MVFDSMATATISTKRSVRVSAGRYPAPATYLTNVKITPIMPMETTTQGRGIDTRPGVQFQSAEYMQFFTEDHSHTKSGTPATEIPDIVEGDIVVSGSIEYTVRSVDRWPTTQLTGFLRVVLEEPQ